MFMITTNITKKISNVKFIINVLLVML